MKKMLISAIAVVLLLSVFTSVALAANVHLKKNPPLTFADQGLILNATGALTGLGNEDVTINLTATADPTTTCTNQGGNQAPGQNPAEVTVSGTQSIPATEIKNGNVAFDVSTDPPAQPTAEEAGCPNSNWTAEITDLSFKTARLTVEQGGVVVFQQTYAV
jgi:hypothetical protein